MAKRVGIDKDAVVRAAAKIADDHGWDALTLARVAKKLRIRSPSLYNHVGGLEGLRRELKLLALRDLNAALSRATIGKSRDDAVRGLAAAYRAFVKRHPGTYAATMVAAPKNDPAMEAAASNIVETILSVLSGYGLDRREGLHAIRALRSTVHGFAALEIAGGFGIPLDVDKSFEWLVSALLAGLSAACSQMIHVNRNYGEFSHAARVDSNPRNCYKRCTSTSLRVYPPQQPWVGFLWLIDTSGKGPSGDRRERFRENSRIERSAEVSGTPALHRRTRRGDRCRIHWSPRSARRRDLRPSARETPDLATQSDFGAASSGTGLPASVTNNRMVQAFSATGR